MSNKTVTQNENKEVRPYNPIPRAAREVYTPKGEKIAYKAKLTLDEQGHKKAERGEAYDLDAQIRAFEQSTDIVSIAKRLQAGDTTVLNASSGISGDLTVLPKDVNDVISGIAMSDQAYAKFSELPADIKALFNDDPAKFYESVINNKVDSILAAYKATQVKANEENEKGVKSNTENEGDHE